MARSEIRRRKRETKRRAFGAECTFLRIEDLITIALREAERHSYSVLRSLARAYVSLLILTLFKLSSRTAFISNSRMCIVSTERFANFTIQSTLRLTPWTEVDHLQRTIGPAIERTVNRISAEESIARGATSLL